MVQNNRFAGTLFDLSGRTALVTGGSRGIGRAISERLAQHGANVAILGRKLEIAQEVAELINSRDGGRALGLSANITRREDLLAAIEAVEAQLGAVDILVANAALHIHVGPSADMSDAILEKTMDANFRALHVLSQRLLPGMGARKWGRIVNIGTIAAHFGSGVYHSYTLSKALAMQYVRNIAVEHGEAGIRANTVSPGLVRTDMSAGLVANPDELAKEMARSTVGRMGAPDEIAGVIVMLASDAGGYVNGQTIAVDGGQTIKYVV
ncbi:SDR family NAD(P)-dependent oxidoreductase [Sphingobium sp. HBC34]|uniref:SDR family NAD(P)-dependent oxidoreductase n=1 Tax=Sphingobium cyanobacteriorum TaxID=3063954 RepID=A0ABT8ZJL9_9SPHN|nr:SDR family NAD(P)-dependent oxidoreductase [Sphingobium sp. HBC34]MDO7834411.1 SDR family NAD(P)-dependent oxidoreductase [Sphingobium sp. HBC34]